MDENFDSVGLYRDEGLEDFLKTSSLDKSVLLKAITRGSSSVFIFYIDLIHDTYYASDNLKNTLGLKESTGHNFFEALSAYIYNDKYKEAYLKDVADLENNKKAFINKRYPFIEANGEVLWGGFSFEAIRDDHGHDLFLIGRIVKENEVFAFSKLTNLPLIQSFRNRLGLYKTYSQQCFVIGVTLRHISKINLEYGSNIGDMIIKDIVDSCLHTLITKLSSYSMSATKYISIVEADSECDIKNIIQDIASIVHGIYRKYEVDIDREASFVVMRFVPEKYSTDEFVENLASLMKASENDVDGNYIDNSELYIDKIHQNAKMVLALNRDVSNLMQGFRLNVQPLIDARTKRIIGGECLLRWKYNSKNVPPSEFIPMLEEGGLISIAGKWVIDEAIKILNDILRTRGDFYLTVNISRKQLEEECFYSYIEEVIKKSGINPSNLVFEITESAIEKDAKNLSRFIGKCRSLGIRLAIDDFGTGYSSLTTFLQYEYDILKIDRTVLLELENSKRNFNFIKGLAKICKKNNVKVCLEGVETNKHRSLAKELGIDIIQGYYYFKPLEVNDLYKLLKDRGA